MSTFYTILASIIGPIIGITVYIIIENKVMVDYAAYMESADRRHEIGKASTKRAAIVILLWFLQSNLQQACQYYFLIVFLPLII